MRIRATPTGVQAGTGSEPGAAPRRGELRVALRYALFQIPGLVGAASILAVLVWAELVTVRTATLLYLLWIAKDAALYPLTRDAYRGADSAATQRLVGRRGVVRQRLAPSGWVFVDGALWRAVVCPDGGPLGEGEEVEVVAVRGNRLTVAVVRDTLAP